MELETINGDTLLKAGFSEGTALGLILKGLNKHFAGLKAEEQLALIIKVKDYPENFLDDEVWSEVALALTEKEENTDVFIELRDSDEQPSVFGSEFIDEGAKKQMQIAMKLPVTVAGALMPDAHQGYGLPIGGVLATKNAVIPYGVGVDIGCRMALSIFDLSEKWFIENESKVKRELISWTRFGAGHGWHGKQKAEHSVLDSSAFNATPFIKNLHDKAWSQLGTSGGGNHFVEFGILDVYENDELLNLKKGKYVSLLSHSGSRGFGATVAGYYTRLAKSLCKLPKEAANLAWLDLNSEEGMEYWLAMNLAGDYASACHEVIHDRLTKALGAEKLIRVENHHNFAWKEVHNGEELIVHRKGATPAGKDIMGIIPGSMTAPGFLVRGKGNEASLQSASHGAGRQLSRTQAIKSISKLEMKQTLKDAGVTLIGAGLDEAPMAYKDIHKVMAAQTNLVDVLASFHPKMVRMADDGSKED